MNSDPATISSIISAATTGFTTIGNDAMSMIAAIVPVALTITGAMIVISIGVKVFKKISGTRT